MKIGDFSTTAANTSNSANKAQNGIGKALGRIAAIRALSSEDASSMAIADSLRMEASSLAQGIRNTNEAIGVLQIANSALSTVNDGANRLNELSVRMNSAILNSDQRAMLQSEANALIRSMDQSINSATYNGKSVFQGSMEFNTGNSTISIYLNAPKMDSLDITDKGTIEEFMRSVDSVRSDIGSVINQMVSSTNSNLTTVVNLRSAESNLQRNDVAENYNELNSAKLKNSAALYANSFNINYLKQQISALLD